jgi:hypothetical protein
MSHNFFTLVWHPSIITNANTKECNMAGSINLAKLTTLAVTRNKITVGAPYRGYTADEAYDALRKQSARISQAIAERAGFRLCDMTNLGISACGGYVTATSFIWRD